MFKSAAIIPTGDELKEGIVLDTDSPMIMQTLLSINGRAEISRLSPVTDVQSSIVDVILKTAKDSDLIVLIGGSGGGHRHSETLGKDFTHSSLEEILTNKFSQELYGKNGHMWCKLVIGNIGETLVINVPGPFEEAKAAMSAFKAEYAKSTENLEDINKAMIEAVKSKYGKI